MVLDPRERNPADHLSAPGEHVATVSEGGAEDSDTCRDRSALQLRALGRGHRLGTAGEVLDRVALAQCSQLPIIGPPMPLAECGKPAGITWMYCGLGRRQVAGVRPHTQPQDRCGPRRRILRPADHFYSAFRAKSAPAKPDSTCPAGGGDHGIRTHREQ